MKPKRLVSLAVVTTLVAVGMAAVPGRAEASTASAKPLTSSPAATKATSAKTDAPAATSPTPVKPLADCATAPDDPNATDANRTRFINLWAPRVTNKAWITSFAGLSDVPDDIKAEGFHAMSQQVQAWLVACLVDSVLATANITASTDQIGEYQLGLDSIIFGKAQLQAARQQFNAKSDPNLHAPAPVASGALTAATLKGMVSRLASTPSLTSASFPAASVTAPAIKPGATVQNTPSSTPNAQPAAAPNPNFLADLLAPILTSPLLAALLAALNDLEQLISQIQAVLFTLPVLNLAATLFYHVCAESATQPLACSPSLPIGVPIPTDVDGDHFPDVLCELIPVVANGTDFGVSFSVTRLPTAHVPLAAHVFMVYDIPLANKRLEYGYDGRASTLAANTDTKVTLVNAFHAAFTGDVNVQAKVTSISPGSSEALTVAVKDLVNGSVGHPPTEANPMVGAVSFTPFPKTLTMSAHLTHNAQDENIFTVGSDTQSTVNAMFQMDMTNSGVTARQTYQALIDKLPTSVVVDLKRNGNVQTISYTASSAIAHAHASMMTLSDVSDPMTYSQTDGDILGVPSSVIVTLTGAQDITYSASSVIPQIAFSTKSVKAGVLQQVITAQAFDIPETIHLTDNTGPDLTSVVYDADSYITKITFEMYDLAQNGQTTDMSATATSIPTHMQFTAIKSTGLYDVQTSPTGIGKITATLSIDNGAILSPTPAGDHVTVLKVGQQLGVDFQLTGFQSAHFESATKTIVGLGLSPGGQSFTAIADLNDPNVRAEVTISNLPSTVSVTDDPAGQTITYNASASVNNVHALFKKRDTGDYASADINGVPKTITLTLDAANQKIGWNASSATGGVDVEAHVNAATLNLPFPIDAQLIITSIPATFSIDYSGGGVDFEAPSPGIGAIEAHVSNHGLSGLHIPSGFTDYLGAYFSQSGSGDPTVDANLHISNLTRAKFVSSPSNTSGGGFTADLNMGNQGSLGIAAEAHLDNNEVIANGQFDHLPSAIHLQDNGGDILYSGNSNPTLTLSVKAGDSSAVSWIDANNAPPMVHGIAIRDGKVGSNVAVEANLFMTGLPDGLNLNTTSGVYTVSNFAPTQPLHVDVLLNAIVPTAIKALLEQDFTTVPVSFVFGPFLSSTVDDGTGTNTTKSLMSFNYTATQPLGALTAEVSFGGQNDAQLYISNIPGGTSPSISFSSAFGTNKIVDLTMSEGISEIKASFKHHDDPMAAFNASVDLTHVPASVHLKIGNSDPNNVDGDPHAQGASAPQVTFTASDDGLTINAMADATVGGQSGAVQVLVDDMSENISGGLNGTTLTVAASSENGHKTGAILITAQAHIRLDVNLAFNTSGFDNTGNLHIDFILHELIFGVKQFNNLGLQLGVTTGVTGDFAKFDLGEDSELTLSIYDRLDFGFDLPIIGHVSINLISIGNSPIDPFVIPLGNVIDHWHVSANIPGTIFTIPVFEIPFVISCGVDVNVRPSPYGNFPATFMELDTPIDDHAGDTPAWLITPSPLGGILPDWLLDVVAYFESPYGNDLSFNAHC